jgi:hypothetical protein
MSTGARPIHEDDPLDGDQIEQLAARTYAALQVQFEHAGAIPRPRATHLDVHRSRLELMGALQLGLLTAAFSVLAIFVVVNVVFHLSP